MLHACVERFDVMGGRGNILSWVGEVNKALSESDCAMTQPDKEHAAGGMYVLTALFSSRVDEADLVLCATVFLSFCFLVKKCLNID
jgi:hypothetical protein